MEMRSLADWTIRPRLLGVPGVSQVTIFGGEVKQYQVIVKPDRLREYGLSLSEVRAAAARANENTAAGFLQTGSQTLPIQGEGRVRTLEDLAGAVVAVRNSQPIRLRDLADVRLGPEFKVGDASTEGRPSVNFIILKQPWASTLTVTTEVESALDELQTALPSGVQLNRDIFRQADFIERSIQEHPGGDAAGRGTGCAGSGHLPVQLAHRAYQPDRNPALTPCRRCWSCFIPGRRSTQ